MGSIISFTGILTFKNSAALRAIAAGLPADRILVETDAPYLAPGKFRGKRNEPAYVVETAKVLAETRGVSFDEIARQTTANFFRLFGKVPRPAEASQPRCPRQASLPRMTLKFTILGCGSSGGVPRPALGWGDCDPNNPKNRRRRTSLLVERKAPSAGDARPRSTPRPICASRLLDAEVDWVDGVFYTHEHADHTHGIDDLRALFIKRRRRVDVYLDEQTAASMQLRFGYCFKSPPGSEYPPIVTEHRLAAGKPVDDRGGGRRRSTALPFRQEHGDIASLGFRFGNLAYSCDLSGMPAGKRRGPGRPRRLDRRRVALPAAPEPFLARRRARAGSSGSSRAAPS